MNNTTSETVYYQNQSCHLLAYEATSLTIGLRYTNIITASVFNNFPANRNKLRQKFILYNNILVLFSTYTKQEIDFCNAMATPGK